MKLVSTVTLGLALALGTAATLGTATPALAAKAPKAPAAPTPKLSPEFRKAIVVVEAAAAKKDVVGMEAAIAAAQVVTSAPDEKFYLGARRFDLAKLKDNDRVMMRIALNEMLSSGSSLMGNPGEIAYNVGALAYDAGDFPDAIAKMADADRLGSKEINRFLLAAEANIKLAKPVEGLALIEKAIAASEAAGTKAPESWYGRAASVAYKSKITSEVAKWTALQVRAYPTAENWRSALVIYRDSNKLDGQLQLDLFRLMRVTKSLAGERDFYEYAQLAIERALPGEAKAVIEEGYATKAMDPTKQSVRERLAEANAKIPADKASVAADVKRAGAAPDGKLAVNTAGAELAYGDYAKAIELFRLGQQKGGVDADMANTRLGIALALAGQKVEARSAFAAVAGARKPIADFWLLWLDLNP